MRSSLPIRWRIALLIASATSLVLIAFAFVVATTVDSRLRDDFEQTVSRTAGVLAENIEVRYETQDGDTRFQDIDFGVRTFARGSGGVIRVVAAGRILENTQRGVSLGEPRPGRRHVGDLLVDTRQLTSANRKIGDVPVYVQYGRSTRELEATISRIHLLLA
ncbi:MAG: hypothetical protein JHD16_15155, partial [Solirubrobacteraceae bacterium]|nr:hypothetical protein [Solirubrobacteraceae bacterium]